jgi:hypothetical protein
MYYVSPIKDKILDTLNIIHIKKDIVLDTNLLRAHCTNVRGVLFQIAQILVYILH